MLTLVCTSSFAGISREPALREGYGPPPALPHVQPRLARAEYKESLEAQIVSLRPRNEYLVVASETHGIYSDCSKDRAGYGATVFGVFLGSHHSVIVGLSIETYQQLVFSEEDKGRGFRKTPESKGSKI